jgi:acetyltransferase-like isoleucine patch superfamily enzyme
MIVKKLIKTLKLFLYYVVISKLPHSRFGEVFNWIRVWYLADVLKVLQGRSGGHFQNDVYISNANNVQIGVNCHINEHVFIQGACIGNYVMIAPYVSILSSNHNHQRIDIPMVLQGEIKNIIPMIDDDVWIGRNAVIFPGVRVGRGSIIGAGAIVNKDVLPGSVVGGVPARLIRMRVDNANSIDSIA